MALLALAVAPRAAVHGGPVTCPVRRSTGLPCPACGLSRSWQATLHGDLGDGVRWHPLGPLALVVLAAIALDAAAPATDAGSGPAWARAGRLALVAGWVAVWAVRVEAARRARRRVVRRRSEAP
jgi:hypothetical protein